MATDVPSNPGVLDPTFLQPRESTHPPSRGLSPPKKWSRDAIAEGLKNGRLSRLRVDPPKLLTTLVGSSCRSVRFHNELWALDLETPRVRWRLDGRDTAEMTGPNAEAQYRIGDWSYLYGDRSTGALAALDERGRLIVEWALRDWCDGYTASEDLSTHRAQKPPKRRGRLAEFEIHRTDVDHERYHEAWRRCESFRETAKLEKAARTDRQTLLQHLPADVACGVGPRFVRRVLADAARYEGPLTLELAGRGYRFALRLNELHVRSAGRISAVQTPQLDGLLNWGAMESAYHVSLSRRGRTVRALEVVDPWGDFAFRLRRPYDASPRRVFSWRALLEGDRQS